MNKKQSEVPRIPFTVRGTKTIFHITKAKIGAGTFASVYQGVDKTSGEVRLKTEEDGRKRYRWVFQTVAVKLERINSNGYSHLFQEKQVYKHLSFEVGFARFLGFSIEDNYNILVLEQLGPSLEDLFNSCSRKFTVRTVCMLAEQMIRRISLLHSKNILHRDIKPENLLMGQKADSKNTLYLIDFGLAKRYVDSHGNHILYREDRNLIGTARYASVHVHLGMEQSRRDDLESIGYLLVYFLKGSLPWQEVENRNKHERYEEMGRIKRTIELDELYKDCPQEFKMYMNYVKRLEFEAAPNYEYLRQLFVLLLASLGHIHRADLKFDWDNDQK